MKFNKYNFDKSCYLNWKEQFTIDLVRNAKPAKKLKDNIPYAFSGIEGKSDQKVFDFGSKFTSRFLDGDMYYQYLIDNNESISTPENKNIKFAVPIDDTLQNLVDTQGYSANTDYNSPNETDVLGVAGPSVLGSREIETFINRWKRSNPTFVVKGKKPNASSLTPSPFYFLPAPTIPNLFSGYVSSYIDSLEDDAIISIKGRGASLGWIADRSNVGLLSVAGLFCSGLKFKASSDTRNDYIDDKYNVKNEIRDIVETKNPFASASEIERLTNNRFRETIKGITQDYYDSPETIFVGSQYEEIEEYGYKTMSYYGFKSKEDTFDNSAITNTFTGDVRADLTTTTDSDSGLRFNLLDAFEKDTTITDPLTDEEKFIEAMRLVFMELHREVYELEQDDASEVSGDDSTYFDYNPLYAEYLITGIEFKNLFRKTYNYYRFLEEEYQDDLADFESVPFGAVLNTFGTAMDYLTMDIPNRTNHLVFGFKIANYHEVNTFNDEDKATPKEVVTSLIDVIGKRTFCKCVYPVFMPTSGNDVLAGYYINWTELKSQPPSVFMAVIGAFFGYLSINIKKKKASLLKKIVITIISVVVAIVYGPDAGVGFWGAVYYAGVALMAVGILTGNKFLTTLGSIFMLVGGAMSSGALDDITFNKVLEGLPTMFFKNSIKLLSMVQQKQYDKTLSGLRNELKDIVEEVNEMQEMLTVLDRQQKVKRFIYEESYDEMYSNSFNYDFEYKYI